MKNHLELYFVGGVIFIALSFFIYIFVEVILKGAKWQESKLKRETFQALEEMFIFVDYTKLTYFIFSAFLLIPLIIWFTTGNPIFAGIGFFAPLVLPKLIINRTKKKRYEAFIYQFPDALMMLSSSLRAGTSLAIALENLVKESKAPLNQEFALLIRSQRMGADFEGAIKEMESRLPIQEFLLFSAGLRIAREVGGNLADMLESLADTLYKKLQTEGKIKSLTAQGKIQGVVMTGLPLLLMFVLSILQPNAMAPLFHSITGWLVLLLIAVMEFIGYIGVKKITTIDV